MCKILTDNRARIGASLNLFQTLVTSEMLPDNIDGLEDLNRYAIKTPSLCINNLFSSYIRLYFLYYRTHCIRALRVSPQAHVIAGI